MSLLTTNYLTPTGREEAWRFTPLKRLAGLHDGSTKVADHISLSAKSALPNGVALTVADAAEHPASYTSTDVVTNRIRVVIQAGVNSKSTVIVENSGNGELGEEIEINLAPGASLDLISLQEWDRNAVHLAQHHAIVSKDAQFTSYVVSVGGSVVRISPTVEFTGAGSFADLYGVYFATDGQHLEHRIHVNHNVPNAKSRVNYKGALAGDQAHTVWIGDVYIHKGADGTDTYELNRNLLLSDGARADSVPNLEIETGEIVGAGHASTTGRFDDEQLFYLQSRGIPADIARRLVIRGFFAEIINKLKSAELEERLMQRIDDELAKVGE